jgi:hypothetical protein
VYILSDRAGEIVKIGYAGGLEKFGLRSALDRELASAGASPVRFQYEVNMQYWGRWRELLLRYAREHQHRPTGNASADFDGILPATAAMQR